MCRFFNQICENKSEICRKLKILNFVKIIHYYSKLFTGVLSGDEPPASRCQVPPSYGDLWTTGGVAAQPFPLRSLPGQSPPHAALLRLEAGTLSVPQQKRFPLAARSRRAAAGRAELLASFFGSAVWGNFRENANCGDPVG